MILEGVALGLTHPIEWLEHYSRCIAAPYVDFPERSEFINEASKELYEVFNYRVAASPEDIYNWMNSYYDRKHPNA
jgi:hypothetical protein